MKIGFEIQESLYYKFDVMIQLLLLSLVLLIITFVFLILCYLHQKFLQWNFLGLLPSLVHWAGGLQRYNIEDHF